MPEASIPSPVEAAPPAPAEPAPTPEPASPPVAERAAEAPPAATGESLKPLVEGRVARARQTLAHAHNAVLGTESLGGELGKVASAAGDVGMDLAGNHLRALGKLLTLHPIEAARAEGKALRTMISAKPLVDTLHLVQSSLRATGKGAEAVVKSPFSLAAGAGRLAKGTASMTGHGIAAAAAAPFHLGATAGKVVINAPVRAFDAVVKGLAHAHDALIKPLLSAPAVAAKSEPPSAPSAMPAPA